MITSHNFKLMCSVFKLQLNSLFIKCLFMKQYNNKRKQNKKNRVLGIRRFKIIYHYYSLPLPGYNFTQQLHFLFYVRTERKKVSKSLILLLLPDPSLTSCNSMCGTLGALGDTCGHLRHHLSQGLIMKN